VQLQLKLKKKKTIKYESLKENQLLICDESHPYIPLYFFKYLAIVEWSVSLTSIFQGYSNYCYMLLDKVHTLDVYIISLHKSQQAG